MAATKAPVRPSSLSLKSSANTQAVEITPRLTDNNHVSHFAKVETDAHKTSEMIADRFSTNTGQYQYDMGQRCGPAGVGSAANRNFKVLNAEQRSSPMFNGDGNSDDILERSMKVANVWEESDSRQQPLSGAAQFIGEHVVKIEQSRSLPSTPTGAAVGVGGPMGIQMLPGHRMLQQASDIAAAPSSSSSSHCRTSSLTMTMTMMSPVDKAPATPDSSASSLPRSVTLPAAVTDGGWNGRQRIADRNNNPYLKAGYQGGYEMRNGSGAEMTQYQHHVTMTPSSDDTSPEDFIQVPLIDLVNLPHNLQEMHSIWLKVDLFYIVG